MDGWMNGMRERENLWQNRQQKDVCLSFFRMKNQKRRGPKIESRVGHHGIDCDSPAVSAVIIYLIIIRDKMTRATLTSHALLDVHAAKRRTATKIFTHSPHPLITHPLKPATRGANIHDQDDDDDEAIIL